MPSPAPQTVNDFSTTTQPVPSTSGSHSATEFVCPRCKSSEKWGMASWCPNCGYYPAVDGVYENGSSWADHLPEGSETPRSAGEENLLTLVAPWMWVLMGGITGILFTSLVAKSLLHDAGLRPGFWSWPQLLIGIVMMLGAHIFAARFAISRDRRVSFNDTIVAPITIWQPTISLLPEGHRRIWSLVWGATAVLSSVLIIGGHDLSSIYHDVEDAESTNKAGDAFGKVVGKTARAAKKNGRKAGSLEEALKNIADDSEVKACLGSLEDVAGEQEAFCDIFGFIPGREGSPAGVLLCSCNSETPKYVGRISSADLTPEAINLIAMKLVGQQSEEPVCACDEEAVWVRPVTRCRVRYLAVTKDGMFDSPQIVTVCRSSVGGPKDSPQETSRKAATASKTKNRLRQ